jgi:hypothetical protein
MTRADQLYVMPMKPEHLLQMKKNRMVSWIDPGLTESKANSISESPYSNTILNEAGEVLMVGGVIEHWRCRAEVWAIFAENSYRYIPHMTKVIRSFIHSLPHKRIEATAVKKFKAAHRFLKNLGFDKEVETLRGWYPTGEDVSMYVIIRDQGGSDV